MFRFKLFFLLVLLACKPKPVTLVIQPESLHVTTALALNDAINLKTILRDSKGDRLTDFPCTFSSANPALAQVRSNGSVVFQRSGRTTILVRCAHLKANVPVRVGPPERLDFQVECEDRCTMVSPNFWKIQLEGTGSSAKLVTRAFDFEGEQVPNIKVQYEIIDTDSRNAKNTPGIGLRKGIIYNQGKEGQYVVLAIVGNLSARGLVESTMPVVDEVKTPSRLRLVVGENYLLQPEMFRRIDQGLQPIKGARISYVSRNPRIAEASGRGMIYAKSVGKTEILAVADSGAFAQIIVLVTLSK